MFRAKAIKIPSESDQVSERKRSGFRAKAIMLSGAILGLF
jgi:hypothetical protein